MSLSKFERARLLSTRSLQIADGAPTKIKATEKDSPYNVALKEKEKDLIPLKVIRYNIGGTRKKE